MSSISGTSAVTLKTRPFGVGAGEPAATDRQVGHHRADIVVRDDHGDLGDRFEQGDSGFSAASLRASDPAVWKAMSEESTLWALPPDQGHRMSVTG